MASASTTKTDRDLEDKMLAFSGDAERVSVLGRARAFKRSWIELAEVLCGVVERGSWRRWAYDSFDEYCKKELHLTPSTAAKLLGSFRFLKTSAPKVIERARTDENSPIPDIRAVQFVARATERGALDDDTMAEMQRAAFEEGARVPSLSRRYKAVAFPISVQTANQQLLQQLATTGRRLAALLADADSQIPHDISASLEEALGRLLACVDKAN